MLKPFLSVLILDFLSIHINSSKFAKVNNNNININIYMCVCAHACATKYINLFSIYKIITYTYGVTKLDKSTYSVHYLLFTTLLFIHCTTFYSLHYF